MDIRVRGNKVEEDIFYNLESNVIWDGWCKDIKARIALAKSFLPEEGNINVKQTRKLSILQNHIYGVLQFTEAGAVNKGYTRILEQYYENTILKLATWKFGLACTLCHRNLYWFQWMTGLIACHREQHYATP